MRTSTDPLALSLPVQQQVAALDAALPVYDVLTMQQILGTSDCQPELHRDSGVSIRGTVVLLAGVGLYGVLSYLVTQRVTEIGIRIALGAQRGQVLRLVFLDGLRPVFVGLVIGLAGGAGAGMLIRSILYGTRPLDTSVFVVMVGTLSLTAIGGVRASGVACVADRADAGAEDRVEGTVRARAGRRSGLDNRRLPCDDLQLV